MHRLLQMEVPACISRSSFGSPLGRATSDRSNGRSNNTSLCGSLSFPAVITLPPGTILPEGLELEPSFQALLSGDPELKETACAPQDWGLNVPLTTS